jgi:hypothetical protein
LAATLAAIAPTRAAFAVMIRICARLPQGRLIPGVR